MQYLSFACIPQLLQLKKAHLFMQTVAASDMQESARRLLKASCVRRLACSLRVSVPSQTHSLVTAIHWARAIVRERPSSPSTDSIASSSWHHHHLISSHPAGSVQEG